MLSIFKKKKKVDLPAVLPPLVDLHSHLIPGIDDGAQTLDESVALIKALQEVGYQKLITTPHIMFDNYRNTKTGILQGLQKLQEELLIRDISIEIEAAAEYYLDEGFKKLIEKKEILAIDGKYILFETSYTHRPHQLEEIIFEIEAAGYIPLLAHPERYRYIKNREEEYGQLKSLSVEFQVNINSLSGYYGNLAQTNALFLSENGMIDFLGSDTHNLHQVQNLAKVFKSDEYKMVYLNNTIKNGQLF